MLEIAGLSPTEEAAYLALLVRPLFTVSDATNACHGLTEADLRAVLESLADKGLLTRLPGRPRRYAPVSPEMALASVLAQREDEVRQARAALATLAERYRAVSHQTGAEELVEIVTGKHRTLQRWYGALNSAASQVRVLSRPPFEGESAEPSPAELQALSRGVTVKVVYDESGVRSPTIITRRRAEIAAGEQARMTGQVPLHLLLVDDRLAVLPLRQDRPRTDGVLIVRPCALLDALSALFELTWKDAVPFILADLDASGPVTAARADGLPPALRNLTTRTVLGLLAAGLSDQAIARRLGCSERTVQRHVQRLTEAVGAKTRFQAALAIGHHHWAG